MFTMIVSFQAHFIIIPNLFISPINSVFWMNYLEKLYFPPYFINSSIGPVASYFI